MLKNYKELKVWGISYQLCLKVYRMTAGFAKEESFGLTSQIKWAVCQWLPKLQKAMDVRQQQIISDIYIAYGLNCELKTQIILSKDLGYIDSDVIEVLRMRFKPSNPGILES